MTNRGYQGAAFPSVSNGLSESCFQGHARSVPRSASPPGMFNTEGIEFCVSRDFNMCLPPHLLCMFGADTVIANNMATIVAANASKEDRSVTTKIDKTGRRES